MKDKLIARRAKAEDAFNSFQEKRQQKQEELTQIDAELNRLQGEYRLLNEQIDAESNKKASVIDATEVDPPKEKK